MSEHTPQRVVLQRLVLPATVETAELYWRHEGVRRAARLSPDILPGGALDLDTYFNSFDENAWQRHTGLRSLAIELTLEGSARIELWRHSRAAPGALLAEAQTSGGTVVLSVPPLPHPRAAGRLALRIVAIKGARDAARLVRGHWRTDGQPKPVRLMPVICTFDRDAALAALLARLAADEPVLEAVARVIVINNGTPGLPDRLAAHCAPAGRGVAGKLHIVEQGNFGGAGGFTRGLLEARALGATHIILMDDDVVIEPESVLRTIRFYELATTDVAVAGHMLDLFRPTDLYEGGARLDDAKLSVTPLHLGAELSQPGSLNRFFDETPMHYNGWWFMGLPLTVLDRLGYPMPCFIRGDDVEFGRRLHDAGVPLVSAPGIGIWHEPFYAKLGSWHIYYEFRNMFVLAACHLPNPGRRLGFVALKWIVAELLMFRYQRAALLIRAVEDFLGGPAIYARNPREVHASLAGLRAAYPPEVARRETVLHRPEPARGPRTRAAFLIRLAASLLSEWRRPDGSGRTIAVEPRDHLWFRVRSADAVVVREAWEVDQPLYRRSRATFRTLLRRTGSLAWRMRAMPDVAAEWRLAHPGFTSEAAWRRYLGLDAGSRIDVQPKSAADRPAVAPSVRIEPVYG